MKKRIILAAAILFAMQGFVSAQGWTQVGRGMLTGGFIHLIKGDYKPKVWTGNIGSVTGNSGLGTGISRLGTGNIDGVGQPIGTRNNSLLENKKHNWQNTNQRVFASVDYYQKGEQLFLNGDTANARYFLECELRNNPKNGRAWYYMARIKGEKKGWEKYIDKALKHLPKNDWEFRIKANCLKGSFALTGNDTNSAMKYFNTAMDLTKEYHWMTPADSDMQEVYTTARFNRGCVYYSRSVLDSAIVDFEEVVARGGRLRNDALLSLMWLHYQRQNYKAAHVDYVKLQSYNPQRLNNAIGQILMADIDLKLGHVGESCRHLDGAMKISNDSAWTYLAECWQEDSVRAKQLLDAWADVLADKNGAIGQDEMNLVLGSFAERGKANDLVRLYEQKKAFYADYTPLLLCASIAYFETENLEEAVDVYNRFTKNHNPNEKSFGKYDVYTIDNNVVQNMNNNILLCKAVLYLESNSFDLALAILNTLPDSILNEDILSYCIFLNNVNKNYDQSLRFCNRLVLLEPSADAYAGRGWVYTQKGLHEEAEQDYKKVLELEADSVITWNSASAYFYLGNKRKAEKTSKELLSSDSLSFYDYFMASLFYETLGEERKSVKYFKDALKKEHDKDIYPIVIMSYETESVRKKIEALINKK